MAKGFFSQGIAILFEQPPSLDDLARAVAPREVVNRLDGGHHWAAGGACDTSWTQTEGGVP